MRPLILCLLLGCDPKTPPPPAPSPSPSPAAQSRRPAPPLDLGGPLPDPAFEWIIDATAPEGGLYREPLLAAFDGRFFDHFDLVELYGLPEGKDRMVPVRAPGAPDKYARVAFGLRLVLAASDDDLRVVSRPFFDTYAAEVRKRASTLGLAIRPRTPADEALATAQRLRDLWFQTSVEARTIVTAPNGRPFDAKKTFAALTALGLRRGEEGLFHGDGFQVRTTTPPGRLVDEKRPLGDLVLIAYLPPAADPVALLDTLIKNGEALRRKLGGSFAIIVEVAGNKQPLAAAAARARVKQMVSDLAAARLQPGSPSTTRLFTLP